MSFIADTIYITQDKDYADFVDAIINKLTKQSNHIDLLYNNFRDDSIENNTDYYFDLLIMGKYIIRFKLNTNNKAFDISYSVNDETSFIDINFYYKNINVRDTDNSPYMLNYFLLNNDTTCLLGITSYNYMPLYYEVSNNYDQDTKGKHFLCIKKDNNIIFKAKNNFMGNGNNNNDTFYLGEETYKAIDSINSAMNSNQQTNIYYGPKIIKDKNDNVGFLLTDDVLDCSCVPTYSRVTINDHKYFAYNNYTLLKYD